MLKVKKIPYYTMERSIFRSKVWKIYSGKLGAVPINTPQTVSFERKAPGNIKKITIKETIVDKIKIQPVKEVENKINQKTLNNQQIKIESNKSQVSEFQNKEKLPEFDIQDIPNAMENIGWPISAKIARKWFSSPKNIYNDQPNSVQPIEMGLITLKWVLKFGNVNDRFNELIGERIYSANAIAGIKKKITDRIEKIFVNQNSSELSFSTESFINDIRQFHIDWQIQFQNISSKDTFDGLLMTDLTGALGNFNLYAAIGYVKVNSEKYYKYDAKNRTKTYCIDATASVTHVYVYLKDNYSFNDKNKEVSQYLGHWNKKDMILSYAALVSDLVDGKNIQTRFGNSSIEKTKINWDYLPEKPMDKPVDKRTGIIRNFLEKDIYWPIYNKTYNEWREKHNMGGDFMIYSKPQLYKLENPIKIKLETICKPSEPM